MKDLFSSSFFFLFTRTRIGLEIPAVENTVRRSISARTERDAKLRMCTRACFYVSVGVYACPLSSKVVAFLSSSFHRKLWSKSRTLRQLAPVGQLARVTNVNRENTKAIEAGREFRGDPDAGVAQRIAISNGSVWLREKLNDRNSTSLSITLSSDPWILHDRSALRFLFSLIIFPRVYLLLRRTERNARTTREGVPRRLKQHWHFESQLQLYFALNNVTIVINY